MDIQYVKYPLTAAVWVADWKGWMFSGAEFLVDKSFSLVKTPNYPPSCRAIAAATSSSAEIFPVGLKLQVLSIGASESKIEVSKPSIVPVHLKASGWCKDHEAPVLGADEDSKCHTYSDVLADKVALARFEALASQVYDVLPKTLLPFCVVVRREYVKTEEEKAKASGSWDEYANREVEYHQRRQSAFENSFFRG